MNSKTAAPLISYVLLLFVAFASRSRALGALYLVVSLIYVLRHRRTVQGADVRDLELLGLMVVGPTAFFTLSILRIGYPALVHFLVAITAALAAFAATRDRATYWLASRCVLFTVQAAVLVYLAKVGLTGFPLEDMIPQSSANGITSYLLALQINYGVASYVVHRRFSLWSQLVTMFICVVGYGRGSILTSAGLLLTTVLAAAIVVPGRRRLGLLLLIGLSTAAIVSRSEDAWRLVAGTKVGSGLVDESRLEQITSYMGQLTIATAITGGSYENTPIANTYNGNPHNAFIRAHHIFGACYLGLILVLPFWALRGAGTRTSKLYLGLLMTLLYFRAFTEPIVFPTLLDFFVFAMCFLASGLSGERSGVVGVASPSHPRREFAIENVGPGR